MASNMKPVVVVIPEKKNGSCALPLVINGVTFDLSAPSRIIRLPKKTHPSSSDPISTTHTHSNITGSHSKINLQVSPTHSCTPVPKPALTLPAPPTSMTHRYVNPPGSSHKEVERRRKLKISTCIQQLAESLPFTILGKVSHGDVLEKVIEHIAKLKQENDDLHKQSSPAPVEELKGVHAKLLLENILLKELLHQLKQDEHESQSHAKTSSTERSCDVTEKSHDKSPNSPSSQTKPASAIETGDASLAAPRSPVVSKRSGETSSLEQTTSSPPVHQTWPVTSLLAVTQGTTSGVSSNATMLDSIAGQPSSATASEQGVIAESALPSSHQSSSINHGRTHSKHREVQSATALPHSITSSSTSIVQPWINRGDSGEHNYPLASTFQPFNNVVSPVPHLPSSRESLGNHNKHSVTNSSFYSYQNGLVTSRGHYRSGSSLYRDRTEAARGNAVTHHTGSRSTRYKPYRDSPGRSQLSMHPSIHHTVLRQREQDMCQPHLSYQHSSVGDSRVISHYHVEYPDQSRYTEYPQSVSHDSHVMPYDTPPYESQVSIQQSHGSVWRPYSEPHRLSGFGLTDILSHSHSEGSDESLHLEPTPPTHVSRIHSFLVDSLLDDM